MSPSLAILFQSLKETVDGYFAEYTEEKMPPPWQTYTIPHKPGRGNLHIIQKTFEGPFSFDVLFSAASSSTPTSSDLTTSLKAVARSFTKKYLDVHAPQKPFASPKYLEFSKSMFSNLIGGIGYFYGDQLVDRSYAPEYDEENEGFWREAEEARGRNSQKLEGPYELFTSIPSRPFFPRGFLWDEGFHLLPILDWDAELVMQILSSWFGTMDSDGWIPREQILGPEARSKVPVEFQVQYPHYANPPTLFMVLESLLDKLDVNADADLGPHVDAAVVKNWLVELYPLLQRNFHWYKRTQWGDIRGYDREARSSKEGYRWRGRTPRHVLTSGLDDYPRAQPPHPGELHVDLLSWMGLMSRCLRRVAEFVGEEEDAKKFAKVEEAIVGNVEDLHWSEREKAYCDASVDAFEESVLVCHKGVFSFFFLPHPIFIWLYLIMLTRMGYIRLHLPLPLHDGPHLPHEPPPPRYPRPHLRRGPTVVPTRHPQSEQTIGILRHRGELLAESRVVEYEFLDPEGVVCKSSSPPLTIHPSPIPFTLLELTNQPSSSFHRTSPITLHVPTAIAPRKSIKRSA